MKFKLILFLLIFSSALSYAQTGFKGNIVDGNTGFPLSGVNVVVRDQNQYVRSGQNGEFIINLSGVGEVFLDFFAPGYADVEILTLEVPGQMVDLGTIRMTQDLESDDSDAFYIDESQINDEDGSNQTIGSIGNGSDDIFLNAASFNFSPMRFSIRGYDQQYTTAQINGVSFNDGARGRFNYSMLGGMNQMFRNRDVTRYTEASGYGYGDIAGSTNIISRASGFAKGVSANIGATNRAYVLRAMVSAASGILPSGWAFNGSLIYRWSDEGAWDGTFYNSFGYYLGAEKIFNENHKQIGRAHV